MSISDELLAKLDKTYGKGAVMRLGDKPDIDIPVIPTGSISIDRALGVGGFPKGRIVEIYGPESSGKTTLAIHTMASAQLLGGNVAIVDAEHAFDTSYAKKLGVDIKNLAINQPDNGEQGLDILIALLESKEFDLIVVDSVAALTPKAELEGEMGDSQMGLQARMMSKAMRKITGIIGKSDCVVIFINQLRDKIGIVYGNPATTTGGNALKFYSSIRVEISKGSQIKDGEEIVGSIAKIKIVKNKLAPPFKKVEVDMMYGKGIDPNNEVFNFAVDRNIIKKSGSWYSFGEIKLGQGKNAVLDLLHGTPDLFDEVKKLVTESLNQTVDE